MSAIRLKAPGSAKQAARSATKRSKKPLAAGDSSLASPTGKPRNGAEDWAFANEAERLEAEALSREIDRKLEFLLAQSEDILRRMEQRSGA